MEARGCIACAGAVEFFGVRAGYTHVKCNQCGSLQLSPFPGVDEVERAYRDSKYSSDDAHGQGDPDVVRKMSRVHYECIRNALQEERVGGTVLDCGAGWGGLVEVLLQSGFSARGVEMSKGMVAECVRRGLPVTQGDLRSADLERESLGAITMCGVFEHLLDFDGFLEGARKVIANGGYFLTLQPSAPFAELLGNVGRFGMRQRELPGAFYIFDPPWHSVLFSIEGMKLLTERHGFVLRKVLPVPQGRMPGWPGLLQRVANPVNKVGWAILDTKWPLMVSHLYVFRKVS